MIMAMALSTGKRSIDTPTNLNLQLPYKLSQMAENSAEMTTAAAAATTMQLPPTKLHTNSQPQFFTKVHLQLLKALYDSESSTYDESNEDDRVEEKHWACMELFLKERRNIKTMSSNARDSGIVHEEAADFRKVMTNKALTSTPKSNQSAPVQKMTHKKSSSKKHSIRPTSARYFSASKFGCSPGSARGRFMSLSGQSRSSTSQEIHGGNAYGIIAGMLQQKHKLTSSRFHHVAAAPLKELVQDAQARKKVLESKLKVASLMQRKNELSAFLVTGSEGRGSVLESSEERRVRIESKLDLWSILLQDVASSLE